MRRLNLVLLATLQLCGARSTGFNIHEDLLAFPQVWPSLPGVRRSLVHDANTRQFEVTFSEDFISEKDAHALLEENNPHPTYSADFSQATAGENVREASDVDADQTADAGTDTAYTYELMTLSPHRYLCSIPVIQPPAPENATANELAKAEEARELSRATANGWELLSQLEDSCLYFMSGWWSYSFCNNHEIVQFHALPSIPNGQPPRRDPHTAKFILGQIPTIPASANYPAKKEGQKTPYPAELQIKGDQRYLVQKLEGGTICDLTGRERTIEVQYHCVPGMKGDRIGWIKEVTICAYLMVVNTPRLCEDVAFLPPQETKANPISCQLIVEGDATTPLIDQSNPLVPETQPQSLQDKIVEIFVSDEEKREVNVGGVTVGARNVLSGADEPGKPPAKLAPPRSYFPTKPAKRERFLEVVAQGASKEEGGDVKVLSQDELKKLELDPDTVEEMKEKMKKMAGDDGWRLEIVELVDDEVRELRGYIEGEDEDGKDGQKAPDGDDTKTGGEEGSEEQFFKEDL